ncbi:sulfatase [Mangrovibacterium sp.]|uniref:sulfatase family protein n=1 Tax=Mangrovibacterium sp. TaxID=1961364 RepID=UPI0035641222
MKCVTKRAVSAGIPFVLLFAGSFVSKAADMNKHNRPNIVWIVSEDNSKHYLKHWDENGVETPNIESLAEGGLTFVNAFSNAPVCSAARSTIITSCYGPRLASHYHRKIKQCPMPEGMEMFPSFMRKAGYYTTNCSKEDYNLQKADNVWDESSKTASWRNRAEGQPFFHVKNIETTHESRMHFSEEIYKTHKTVVSPETVFVQPNHPQTDLFRYSNAYYRDQISKMDKEVGQVVEQLRKDGLLENTFVFYYSDHGGVLPGSKGYLAEVGLEVPMVVRIPEAYRKQIDFAPGSSTSGFVSFVDLGPTVLNLAGIEIPTYMDGKAFLGTNVKAKELAQRDETFGYANRFDEKYDMVRTYRKGNFKYERNYMPFNMDGLMNNYRYEQLAYQEWKTLFDGGQLNKEQSYFYEEKQPEALYDLETDPYEMNNLANNPEYAKILNRMRNRLVEWELGQPDLSFFPEFYILNEGCNDLAKFGQDNKLRIAKYIEVADLMLSKYSDVKVKIASALESSDEWERYWGLIVCSSFKGEAAEQKEKAEAMAVSDPVLINRVRAAEFLALAFNQSPVQNIQKALYETSDPVEALLMLNSVVLLRDHYTKYQFDIDSSKLKSTVLDDGHVVRRLEYLGVLAAK